MSQALLNRAYRDRCHWDGTPIQPIFRVEWLPEKEDSEARHFCCICCAQSWMAAQQMRQGRFSVRDEISGFPMDALSGYYVESESVTETVTGCRTHVFREPLHARAHLLKHQGRPVPCPLQLLQKSNAQRDEFRQPETLSGSGPDSNTATPNRSKVWAPMS